MEEGQKKTSYDSGEHSLLRINNLWNKVHFEVSLNHYYLWNTLLDRVYCELVNLMNDTEYDTYSKEIIKIDEKIASSGKIVDDIDKEKGFEKIKKEDLEKRTKQYSLLMEKERFIRRIQQKIEKKVVSKVKKDWD